MAIDPYGPVTEEEIISVIQEHEYYLKSFEERRIPLLDSAESMDGFIQAASLRGRPITDGTYGPTNAKRDKMADIVLEASRQLEKQEAFISSKLYDLAMEEEKVLTIWLAIHDLPKRETSILLDMYRGNAKNKLTEIDLTKKYNVSKTTLWRIRKKAIEKVIEKCATKSK